MSSKDGVFGEVYAWIFIVVSIPAHTFVANGKVLLKVVQEQFAANRLLSMSRRPISVLDYVTFVWSFCVIPDFCYCLANCFCESRARVYILILFVWRKSRLAIVCFSKINPARPIASLSGFTNSSLIWDLISDV